jgi:hypothetical protein
MTKENLVLLTVRLYNLTLLLPKKEPLRCRAREAADDILASFIGGKKESNGFSLKESLDIMDSYLKVAISQNWVAVSDILEIQQEYAKINQDLGSIEEVSRANQAGDIKVKEEVSINTKEQIRENVPAGEEMPVEGRMPFSIQVVRPAPLMAPIQQPAQVFIEAKESEEADDEEEDDLGVLTESQIKRQRSIIEFLKEKGQAQVWEIQKIFPNISKRTIRRDFQSLLKQGLIERVGERNKTYYKMKVNLS